MTNGKLNFNLDLLNYEYKSNLSSLISLSKNNIETINQREKNFIKEMDEWDYNEHILPDNYFHHKTLELKHLDWLILNSIFITAYSFFENHLQSLARIVEIRIDSKLKINDISGNNYIGQYRKYLDLVGQIDAAKTKRTEWSTIGQYQVVRNKLIHKGGILRVDLQKPLQDQPGYILLEKYNVKLEGDMGHIRIKNTEIIEAFITLTNDLCDKLVSEIQLKFPD